MAIIYDSKLTSWKGFQYHSIVHVMMALVYIHTNQRILTKTLADPSRWGAEFGRAAFIVGHLLDAHVHQVMSHQDIADVDRNAVVGISAHLLFLVAAGWRVTYHSNSILNWVLLCLYVVGHVGMVYFYLNHANGYDVVYRYQYGGGEHVIVKKDVFRCIFALLVFVYMYHAMYVTGPMRYAQGFVATVYMGLIYQFRTRVADTPYCEK
jgi:hypothetical protein